MEVDPLIDIKTSVISIFQWVPETMEIFTTQPAVYFVGVALVGAVAGVTRKFVPMRKR